MPFFFKAKFAKVIVDKFAKFTDPIWKVRIVNVANSKTSAIVTWMMP